MSFIRLILTISLLAIHLSVVFILYITEPKIDDPIFDILFYGFWVLATLVGIIWFIYLTPLKKKGKLSKRAVAYERDKENKIEELVEEGRRRNEILDVILGTGAPLSHTNIDED